LNGFLILISGEKRRATMSFDTGAGPRPQGRYFSRRGRLFLLVIGPLAVILTARAVTWAAASITTWVNGQTLTAADLNANFAQVAKQAVVAGSAQSTGVVAPGQTAWTPIPGLSVTLTLNAGSLVQMSGNGMQRATTTDATSFCQTGYRFTVDGAPRGDAIWGQRILVSNGAASLHAMWGINDAVTLPAGPHTIAIDAMHPTGGDGCTVCGELGNLAAYDGCSMNVIAVPQ
jgi:hypothetical protein